LSPLAYQSLQREKIRRKVDSLRRRAALREPEFRGANQDIQTAALTEIILTGPTRTGKTLANLNKLYKAATTHDNLRGLIVRKVRSDVARPARHQHPHAVASSMPRGAAAASSRYSASTRAMSVFTS